MRVPVYRFRRRRGTIILFTFSLRVHHAFLTRNLCSQCVTRVNSKRPEHPREGVNPLPENPLFAEFIPQLSPQIYFGGTAPMMNTNRILQTMAAAAMGIALIANAQDTPAPAPAPAPAAAPAAPADAAPAPLSTFVLTGPLTWLPPAIFDAGPFGKLSVNGIVTGYALGQNNAITGDDSKQATLSNGEIFIQRADGKVQYYIQAGVYTMPTLGVPFMNAENTVNNFYGPVPVAYLKLQAGKNTQFLIGSLPTLMGAESTFTYQNFNIERGRSEEHTSELQS